MKKYNFLLFSFLILFVGTVVLTYLIIDDLNSYKEYKEEIVETLNAEDRLGNVWEWVPFSDVGSEKMEAFRILDKKADQHYTSAIYYALYLVILVLIIVVSNNLHYRKQHHKMQIKGLIMVFSALSFLYLGLQTPLLEIEAFKDDVSAQLPVKADLYFFEIDEEFSLGVEGRVYFLYHNKSILSLISLLYKGGNFLVAICLIFFSIVFPLFKLLSSIVVFMAPHSKYADKAVDVITKLGKWSMADVFVAAIFLAYFSFANMNVGVDTGSSTLIGAYFFLTFVILSIISSTYLKKVVKLDPDTTKL